MLSAISTALSGLTAAIRRVDASAANIANMGVSGSLDPSSASRPYIPQTTVQTAQQNGGVAAANGPKSPGIVAAYAPDSPFADPSGMIGVPNVDLAEEAVNIKLAEIAYKANIAVMKSAEEMTDMLLRVDRNV